ncbi:MAG TPA: extracellular solute-binding protein [Acidiferrobacterales bacterium]|nr:extracellular solute-binding protein [Acidiferrobacterales bacterium]
MIIVRGPLNKSFPRRRESRKLRKSLDARFRGHDDLRLNQSFLRNIYLILFLAAFGAPASVFAQLNKETASAAEIAMYEGTDRAQRLIAAARKEGSLLLYTSIAAQDLPVITDDFAKKYGIKVNVWRAANDKVLQRVVKEAAAGRHDFDVAQVATIELEAMHREKLLQEVRSPHFKELIPAAVPPHKEWAAHYLNVWVQAYNINKVRKEELPGNYQDLLHPRWKGRLGIESKNEEWFSTVVKGMGEQQGLKFFRELVAANGISVRTGHSLLNNLVVSGEVPLALTVYNYMPEQAKQKGAPIDWFVIEPVIARANGVAVSKKAPHPHAAVLFYDYMLSEDTQKRLVKMNYVPTNKKVESPLKNIPIKLIDPVATLEESEKWIKLYENIVVRGVQAAQ